MGMTLYFLHTSNETQISHFKRIQHTRIYIKLLFESQKCPSGYLGFVQSRESVFAAFPSSFGRSEYKWDDTTAPIEQVLSIVDCFVTLCEEEEIPPGLVWDPITRIVDPANFKAGGIHEPEVVKRWKAMPGCSTRVLSWVKNRCS